MVISCLQILHVYGHLHVLHMYCSFMWILYYYHITTLNFCFTNFNLDFIWIVDFSPIHWALNEHGLLSLVTSIILWHGIWGMVWEQLYPTMQFLLPSNKAPNIIGIQCGGDNIRGSHNTLKGNQIVLNSIKLTLGVFLPILLWFSLIFCLEL